MDLFIYFCGLFLYTVVTLSAANEFSLKGDPCAKFDSCYSKPLLRTCSCDEKCSLFGTCCHDMKKPSENASERAFQCYSNRTMSPVFAKRSCPVNYTGHPSFVLDCLDDEVDEMDVKSHLLVTSHKTKITYWNDRCATCNYEVKEDLEFWSIEVFCPPRQEVDRNLIRRNLTFDADTNQWGLYVGDEFLQCTVKYAPPPYFDEVNHCTPNLISTCPSDYDNEEISKKCSQYYGERKLKNSNIYYRNIHCAICNSVDVKDLECPGMGEVDDTIGETDFREMAEEVFTRGEWLLKEEGKLYECSKGFHHDPFRNRCRKYNFWPVTQSLENSSRMYTASILILVALLMVFYLF